MSIDSIQTIGVYLLGAMGIALLLAILLFFIVIRQMKHIQVPPNAGFSETLHYTPFLLVIFIDLLDFALDILAAPFAWVILDRLGLKALRGVSAAEALIPFTQAIPTMTICWLGVRLLGANFPEISDSS